MSRYNYKELESRALSPDATAEDVSALGEWFENYGARFWNGEYFDINGSARLFRIEEHHFDEDGEFIYADVIGYEVR